MRPTTAVVRFVAVTIAGAWIWLHGGREAYGALLGGVLQPLLDRLGGSGLQLGAAPDRFVGYAAWLGLMAAWPLWPWRRTALVAGAGCAAIFLSHVALSLLFFALGPATSGVAAARDARFVLALLAVDALPFVLWLALWLAPRAPAAATRGPVTAAAGPDRT